MKKQILLYVLIGLFCAAATAQKISKPTLNATEPSESQKAVIEQGVALHNAKKYDEAIAKYQQVLAENPDCTKALYELALTYFTKSDADKALETSFQGAKYKSRELALFYGIIASVWDNQGKSTDAVKLYQDGIKILKGEKGLEDQLAGLYYNLGVTYARQKKYAESRELFKNSVELNFGYASPNYMLAEIFYGTKYKVPAILAAARLISLELNTARTKRSVTIMLDVMKAPKKDEKTGNVNIFLDLNAPTDEGEFGMYDLLLGIGGIKDEKDKDKSDEEIFTESFDTFIGILGEDKKLPKTFVGKNYVPFMVELKKKGYSKILASLILQQDGNKTAEKWITENNQKALEFIAWAKTYKPQK